MQNLPESVESTAGLSSAASPQAGWGVGGYLSLCETPEWLLGL